MRCGSPDRVPLGVLGAPRAVSLPSHDQSGRPERAQAGGSGSGRRSDRGMGEQTPNPPACVEESCPCRRRQECIVDLALYPL
jgi:hypothetical protein